MKKSKREPFLTREGGSTVEERFEEEGEFRCQ